jgi:hypothetical protein
MRAGSRVSYSGRWVRGPCLTASRKLYPSFRHPPGGWPWTQGDYGRAN